jgi:hypothetical protein
MRPLRLGDLQTNVSSEATVGGRKPGSPGHVESKII